MKLTSLLEEQLAVPLPSAFLKHGIPEQPMISAESLSGKWFVAHMM